MLRPAHPPNGRPSHGNSNRMSKGMEEKPRPLREKCGFVHEIPEGAVRNRPERAILPLQNGRNRPKTLKTCRKPAIFRPLWPPLLGPRASRPPPGPAGPSHRRPSLPVPATLRTRLDDAPRWPSTAVVAEQTHVGGMGSRRNSPVGASGFPHPDSPERRGPTLWSSKKVWLTCSGLVTRKPWSSSPSR
jgi:hypothetical protein